MKNILKTQEQNMISIKQERIIKQFKTTKNNFY